jgi:uncharacterized membrane protein
MQTEREPSSKGSTFLLALIFGFVGATIDQEFSGFVFGALLGALLAQVLFLRNRLRALQQRLQSLTVADASPPAREAPETAAPQPGIVPSSAAPRPSPQPPRQPAAAASVQAPRIEPGRASTPPPPPRTPLPAQPGALEQFAALALAWLKRGNPLTRIGIVILFFGAAFLAKYAADRNLFPIELRFVAIALGALVLLIVGWRLREKRAGYAQLLQGGGVAGLYLTVFAATRLYQLLPLSLAFALMVVVALAAAVLAVAQNALSLAVIGTAGGFLAPILVSTGGGNHVALFTYYAILNLGVFAVAWFRTWRVLNVLGFLFTFTITGLWRASGYEPGDLVSADAFLILFFLMYVGVSVLNAIRQPPSLKGYVSGALVFGLPVVAFTLHATMVSRIPYALAWSAMGLGAFYLALGWTLYRTRRENFRLLVEAFAALGVIFASLAIPLAFDTRTTAAMWAVEGAGLVWLGVRQQRRLARAFGALLQVAGGVGFLARLGTLDAARPLLNSAFLGAAMLGVAGLFVSYWLYRNRKRQADYESNADVAFAFWGTSWWLFAGLREIDRFLSDQLGGALVFTSLTAVLLHIAGTRWRWPVPRTIGLFLPVLAAVVGIAWSFDGQHPLADAGALEWLLLFVTWYALLYLNDGETKNPAIVWLHALACWTIAAVISWEVHWQVAERTVGVWPPVAWATVVALVLALLGRRVLRPAWPFVRHEATYRVAGALPLAVALVAWVVIVNLTNPGDPAWLPYVPLFNPLDVTTALCFAALALWWTSLTPAQRLTLWPGDMRLLVGVLTAVVFLWLNAALIRALHHNWGAPITMHGIAGSTLVQSSLSIFWGLLGLAAMTLAARRAWRYVWLIGAGLMIVVAAKLFLVDLSKIGTVARIASFLTVGALLVVTDYVAPLPGKARADGAR